MRILRLITAVAVLAAALVLQVTVLSRLPLPGATPDLVLVVVVALAIAYGPTFGTIAGFAVGLAADLVPPADLAVGRWALVLGLVGYVAGLASTRMRCSAFLPMLMVAGAAVVSVVGYAATGVLAGETGASWRVVNRLIPTAVLYALVLSPIVVSPVLAVVRRLEPDPTGPA
jgi:rod shape-determining protein MreD